jgi:hypothetical protein
MVHSLGYDSAMDIYVQKDGQRLGAFPESRIRHGIDAGEFAPDDLAWTPGKASWQPLSALINLDVNQPPPILDPTAEIATAHNAVEPPDFDVPRINTQTQGNSKLLTVAIEDDDFTVNGVSLLIPTLSSPSNEFLGIPRWQKRGFYYWDDWGITANGDHREPFSSLTVYLRENETWGKEYYPKQPFPGKLLLGGVLITTETKIRDVVANKRGETLVENSTDHWQNAEITFFRTFFSGFNPSIDLYTTHQDTVSQVTFTYRPK